MPFKKPHPLYKVWNSMRQRCRNSRLKQWPDYGGRGITICERWDSFAAFVADMGPRPDGFLIDRIDNNGNYEPRNCRWVSRPLSQRNRRVTLCVHIEGIKYVAMDLAEQSGLKTDTIVTRARAGLSLSEVISSDRRVFVPGLALGGKANGARLLARTHCKNGHPWNEENTRQGKHQRECRACGREKMRRRAEGR